MAGIIFKFLKEVKSEDGSVSKWDDIGVESPSVSIEDVSVTTKAEYQVVPHGTEPKIIPYGVKGDGGRVALITGVFTGRSMKYQSGTDQYLDVLQQGTDIDVPLGRGITLKDATSYELLPELGNPGIAKWRIDNFQWDRQAVKAGQWKFQMTLGYLWDPELNEIQLYDDGIGTNIPDNVKFRVTKYPDSGYNHGTVVMKPTVTTTVKDLNRATFQTINKEFEKGDLVRVYCETLPSSALFYGVVDDIKTSSSGNVIYDCTEVGTLLQRVPCAKIGPGIFRPKVKITNPKSKGVYRTLAEMVALILQIYKNNPVMGFSPGLGIDMTQKWGSLTTLPVTNITIPSQLLSGMSIFGALENLVKDQCGMYMWFDSDTSDFSYGFVRDREGITIDPTMEYILDTKQVSTVDEDFAADYVILYDSEGYWASSITGDVSGLTYVAYKLETKVGDLQLNQMARKIQSDLKMKNDTFKVRFPAGTVRFQDGDVFNCLGDATVDPQMECRDQYDKDPTNDPGDTSWQIKEMTITDSYTECLVGASYYSIFDVYRNKLKRVGEAPVLTETKNCTTSEKCVYKVPDTDEVVL